MADLRVTQFGRVALVDETTKSLRVTQAGRGVLVDETTKSLRVTQAGRSALVDPTTHTLRVTTLGRSVLIKESEPARVTQFGRQVLFEHSTRNLRVTSIGRSILLQTGITGWTIDAIGGCEWLPPDNEFRWSIDGAFQALWYIKVLADWYAELNATCSWDFSTGAGVSDWFAGGLLSIEWDLSTGGWNIDAIGGCEWMQLSDAKDGECITGSGELPAQGGRNYVF